MSTLEFVLGLLVFTVGCTIQGVLGFGAGLFAVPILALIAPDFVPGPVLMANPLLCALFAWREHGAIDRAGLRWALIGRVPGVLFGAWALTAVSEDGLGLLFGTLLLIGVGLKVSGVHAARTPWTLMGAGGLSGFMGTSVAVGGPPIALVLDAWHSVAVSAPYSITGGWPQRCTSCPVPSPCSSCSVHCPDQRPSQRVDLGSSACWSQPRTPYSNWPM